MLLWSIAVMAEAWGEDGGQNPTEGTQEVNVKVTETKYRKLSAELGDWIFNSVGGEGWTKVVTTYSCNCCKSGKTGCPTYYNPWPF